MKTYDALNMETLLAWVKEDPGADHRPTALCGKVYMGETKFKTLFREFTGQSFHEWLTEQRMLYALMLLEQPRFSIKQIARKTGYCYQRNFGKVFRKRWKESPAAWRKKRGIF